MYREHHTRLALASYLGKKPRNKPLPTTFLVSLPPGTPWTWGIVATFHLADKRLTLPSNCTVVLRTTTSPPNTAYTVTNQTTSAVVATGRVEVFKWVGATTSWYGKKRGTWWLNNIDANPTLWEVPGPGVIPTALVMLQAGLRNGKRTFVAMETITMADPLVFAYLYRIFSTTLVKDLGVYDAIPQVLHWYQRMQATHLLGSTLVHRPAVPQVVVPCTKATPVVHVLPAGCLEPRVLPWCTQASERLRQAAVTTTALRKDPRKWDKGGGQVRTKGKTKRTQRALVQVKEKLQQAALFVKCEPCVLELTKVRACCCFDRLPVSVDPAAMMSGKDQRGRDASVKIGKKRSQVQSMLQLILPMVNDGDTAVEFAAGSGYIGLALAALRPNVRVVLMDQNPVSVQYAQARAIQANLSNVECVVGDIRDFQVDGGYAIGFALHACGAASDYVLDHCIRNRAQYVIAPCCAGFMQNTLQRTTVDGEEETGAAPPLPTSQRIREAGVTREEFISLTAGADHSNHPEQAESGRRAMAMLDLDRNFRAEESGKGYETGYYRMVPESCTPKNQILVGTLPGGGGSEANRVGDENGFVVVAAEEEQATLMGTVDEEKKDGAGVTTNVAEEEQATLKTPSNKSKTKCQMQ